MLQLGLVTRVSRFLEVAAAMRLRLRGLLLLLMQFAIRI